MTIGTKLMSGFLVVLLLLGVVAYIGISSLNTVVAEYIDLTDRIDEAMVQARRLDADMLDEARATLGYLLTGEARYRNDFDAAKRDADEALAMLQELVRADEGKAILARIEQAKQAYGSVAIPLFNRTSFSEAEIEDLTGRSLRTTRQDLNKAVEELVAYEVQRGDEVSLSAQNAAAQARILSLAVAAVAMVIGLGVAIFMSRSISRPVIAVANTAQRLAEGDLTVEELKVKTQDEVGEMARAFNQMALNLRQVMHGITVNTQSVMAASEELSASSEQSAQAAQEAAQAVGQVASGASEQSRFAVDVGRTMDQLQQTIQQIASGAGQSAAEVQRAARLLNQMVRALESVTGDARGVAEGARQAAGTARAGADVVGRTVEGMGRIRTVVGESASKIKDLEQLSLQIGEITEVISGIAEQTNLLALNAAIEAARAGEHGRGFAVVAEEVRKLAERSATSAKDIANLIRNIQDRTVEAVQAMVAGTNEVEGGSRLAAEAGKALQEILVTVEQAAADVGSIAAATEQVQEDARNVVQAFDAMAAVTEENTAATEEMAAGAAQVTEAMERIANLSEENAASTEEVSASVEELTASSEEVATSAQGLAKIAQELQEQVGRFRL